MSPSWWPRPASQAKDAAELIEVEYEDRCRRWPTPQARSAPGAPQVHAEAPGNLAFDWHYGDEAAVAGGVRQGGPGGQARAGQQPGDLQRDGAARLRRRLGCRRGARLTLQTCTQGGWCHATSWPRELGLEPEQVRVITPDVGGGFGMKAFFYPEYAMAAYAARALGRPVKWTGERGESFLVRHDGPRPRHRRRELAFDADHRILGLKVDLIANMGAY